MANHWLGQRGGGRLVMRAVDPQTGRLYRVLGPASSIAHVSTTSTTVHPPLSPPPTPIHKARLDNLAIVPASLLPDKAEWQALANTLPVGSTLIVLPNKPSAARAALEQVSESLSAHGSRVTIVELGAAQLRRFRRERITP